MGYKFKRYSESVWFNHPSGGRFKVRAVPPKRFLEIVEACKKGKQIVKGPNGEERIIDDYDDSVRLWAVFCEMIDTWENIDDISADESREKVLEGFFNDKDLRDWIADRSSELLLLHDKQLEGELKNSETSQRGS